MGETLDFVRVKLSKYSMFGYSMEYLASHPKVLVGCIRDEVIHALQRMAKGYDKTATYNVDSHLSEHIPALLRELKAWSNGCPVDLPLPPKKFTVVEGEDEDLARWHAILDEIIAGFEAVGALNGVGPIWEEFFSEWQRRYPKDDWIYFDGEENEEGVIETRENPNYTALMKEMNLWERDKQWRKEQMKLFHRGMILFHFYFLNLWD